MAGGRKSRTLSRPVGKPGDDILSIPDPALPWALTRGLCRLIDSSIGSREVLQAVAIGHSDFSEDGSGDGGHVKRKHGDQQVVSVGFRPLGSIGHATNNTLGV